MPNGKCQLVGNAFFGSSFQWEVKICSFASFMQFVGWMKAFSISATLQSARAGTEMLSSKMHTSSTWAGRITALMVSITAGIRYSVADKQSGGMWQTFCHLLHVMCQKRGQLLGLLSSVLQNLNCLPLLQVIIHHDHKKKRRIHWKHTEWVCGDRGDRARTLYFLPSLLVLFLPLIAEFLW